MSSVEYFKKFSSNTLAASGNQSWFKTENSEKEYTGRVFYKVFAGGKFNYSFLFSNIIDSTFADGSHSYANFLCSEWEIIKARCGVFKSVSENAVCDTEIKFGGRCGKNAAPGDIFYSDSVKLAAESGDYICLELTYCGDIIPYFEEIIIPTFELKNGKFVPEKKVPVAAMLGCDRDVIKRVAFLGDSITEGIGTEFNSYKNWAALIAEITGEKYSYWNLGIGYGRASDAASNGSWLYKAKHMDFVSVCFGVNDISAGYSGEKICGDLQKIITELNKSGCKTGIFTVPPFDWTGEKKKIWEQVNDYILSGMAQYTEYVFNLNPLLSNNGAAVYGGHPDEAGCRVIAENFCRKIKL